MLTKITKSIHSKYSWVWADDESHDKQYRIVEICKVINMDKLLNSVGQIILNSVAKEKKSDKNAKSLLKCATHFYLCQCQSHLERAIKKLTRAIICCKFGSDIFVDCYQLRAKCYLKLNDLEKALFDIETAIKYGSLNKERIMIKIIAFVHLQKYSHLKAFVKPEYLEYDYTEFDIPGYESITKMQISNCIDKANENENKNCDEEANTDALTKCENFYKFDSRCKIVNDEFKGRHLKATDFIPSGTEILVERCYSLVLDASTRLQFCLYCNEYCGNKSIPCRYCKHAIFCNEKCFEYAWEMFHRHECLIIPLFNDSLNVSLHMYRIIVRIGVKSVIDLHRQSKCTKAQFTENNDLSNLIIDEYLENENIQKTPDYLQDQEMKIKQYQLFSTLLDHNEKFESYYDINYMGVAIDVALLLLLNDYLDSHSQNKDIPHWQNLCNDILYSTNNTNFKDVTEFIIFNQTFDYFTELVEIILWNIRKLSTNVFSWNYYFKPPDYVYKKFLATCQCLVASYCNHSCNPNVEWDFKNGFIIYTTTEDVEPGKELNNSYGPYKKMPIIKRQAMLAKNYYFNCCCQACKDEVNEYSSVLRCLECNGPVVVIPETPINASCMNCSKIYLNANERMEIVNEKRQTFQIILHFLRNGQVFETFQLIENLSKSIKYQIYYLYGYCSELQKNILAACEILYRYNLFTFASSYADHLFDNETGQYLYKPNKSDLVQIIKNCIFWLEIYKRFSGGTKPIFINQYLPLSTKQFLIQMQCNVQKLLTDHNEQNCNQTGQSSFTKLLNNYDLIIGENNPAMQKKRNKLNYKEFFQHLMSRYDDMNE